jgi:hypothetical protein
LEVRATQGRAMLTEGGDLQTAIAGLFRLMVHNSVAADCDRLGLLR